MLGSCGKNYKILPHKCGDSSEECMLDINNLDEFLNINEKYICAKEILTFLTFLLPTYPIAIIPSCGKIDDLYFNELYNKIKYYC